MRYNTEYSDGRVKLQDTKTGNFGIIFPKHGNNLLRLHIGYDVIYYPKDESEFFSNPIIFGNPVLFPFPNRVSKGEFEFGGERYRLRRNALDGNAIHGLVFDVPWTIKECFASDDRAYVVSSLRSGDHMSIIDQYPFDFVLTMKYILKENTVEIDAEVQNIGEKAMPFGLGFHPYFNVPLGNKGSKKSCIINIPARKRWAANRCIPDGTLVEATGKFDLNRKSLEGLYLDDGFTDLQSSDDSVVSEIRDTENMRSVRLHSDRNFSTILVYSPEGKPFVCIEPYTCATDAFNLEKKGIKTGLRALGSNEKFASKVSIVVERLSEP